MNSLLTNLADELLVQDITEPSAVLGPLSDHELEAAYDHTLEQFALELLIGADKNSAWLNGKLVIDANHGPIHLLQAAFYSVRLEVQRRGAAVGKSTADWFESAALEFSEAHEIPLSDPALQRTMAR